MMFKNVDELEAKINSLAEYCALGSLHAHQVTLYSDHFESNSEIDCLRFAQLAHFVTSLVSLVSLATDKRRDVISMHKLVELLKQDVGIFGDNSEELRKLIAGYEKQMSDYKSHFKKYIGWRHKQWAHINQYQAGPKIKYKDFDEALIFYNIYQDIGSFLDALLILLGREKKFTFGANTAGGLLIATSTIRLLRKFAK